MILLMRHGEDDASRLGGWSDAGLSKDGIKQVSNTCASFAERNYNIGHIYSSDLQRAKESADIISKYLGLPVISLKDFREINNGDLAGISKERFQNEYPGLYYSSLDWDQQYPNGESPEQFYTRIVEAWKMFKKNTEIIDGDVLLITHAGVINIIRCIEAGIQYSNKAKPFNVAHAEIVAIEK